MSKLEQDERLNRRLVHDRPGRTFEVNEDARWGELVRPAPDEGPDKAASGLRLLLFASTALGCVALERIINLDRSNPGAIHLAALVTDDPSNPDALIGLKKRIWRFLEPEERFELETQTVEAALSHGVPVYTGEVKVDWFHRFAQALRPDAIIVCGFGQLLDRTLIDLPRCGIYNFHPSDLEHGQGAGALIYDDLVSDDARSTVWTVHHLVEEVDAGPIIGHSPPLNIRNADGRIPERAMTVLAKLNEPLGVLVETLVAALAERFAAGRIGKIDTLDFVSAFSHRERQRFLDPIGSD